MQKTWKLAHKSNLHCPKRLSLGSEFTAIESQQVQEEATVLQVNESQIQEIIF